MKTRTSVIHGRCVMLLAAALSWVAILAPHAARAATFRGLGFLPGETSSLPQGLSADGSVVVGQSGSHAFRWTAAAGMVDLGTVPGDTQASAFAVNADGSVVVGQSCHSTSCTAFRWTAASGMVSLGRFPGDNTAAAFGVSGDGSVVVGESLGTSLPHASRWTAATGTQSVASLLTQAGVDVSGWTLFVARRVSADGNTIVANGTDPNGKGQGWIATLGSGGSSCSPLPATTALAAAILPASRSVMVGTTATAFATIINGGPTVACATGIALTTNVPAAFTYNTTDCATNAVTGGANVPVDIPVGAPACFVIALTPSAPFDPVDLTFAFGGSNTVPVAPIIGLNTLLMSASATPVPDIVALAATPTNDGIVDIPGATGTGVFAVAAINLGLSAPMAVTTDTGSAILPISIALCQIDPVTATCISPLGPTVGPLQINTNDTPAFGVFVIGSAFVPFDPANNRIFVRFKDSGGVTRGATSVAVRTQ